MYLQVNILTLAIFIHMLPFWFNFCTNLQTSVTADRMRNLRTNQEPKGAYNTDLHELQKNCPLNYHMTWANRKTTLRFEI